MFPKNKIFFLKNKLKNKKIALIGSNGFVAKNLINLIKDYKITNKKNLIFINRSNTDYSVIDLKKKLQKCNYIIHLSSATGGIGYTIKYPATQFYIALKRDLDVFEACKNTKIEKLVTLSNLHSYSKKINNKLQKEKVFYDLPTDTHLGIGWVKRTLLIISKLYKKEFNLNSLVLISSNSYGKYEDLDNIYNSHIIPSTIYKCLKEKTIKFFGGKNAIREFIYVKDLALIILLSLVIKTKVNYFNIGSGEKVSIFNLVKKIIKKTNFSGKSFFSNTVKDSTVRYCGNTDVKKYLNYAPVYKIEDGLKETISWMKKNI